MFTRTAGFQTIRAHRPRGRLAVAATRASSDFERDAGTTRRDVPGPDRQDAGARAAGLFGRHLNRITRRTDRLFAGLFLVQWIAAIATALLTSPRTWAGGSSQVHSHVWAAVVLGGSIVSLPVLLALTRAGSTRTRLVIAVAQALMGALLIHISGGRIETHFHIFGSLALLAFYRDWRVLVTASVVVAVDHIVRGLYWPWSIFGVPEASHWRWVEHAAWVGLEDVFLILSCHQGIREMRDVADREAALEATRDRIEQTVRDRTAALRGVNEDLVREVSERNRAMTARERAEAAVSLLNVQLERRLGRLSALRRIDSAITASPDLGLMLETLLDEVTSQLGVDAAAVLTLDRESVALSYAAGRGFLGDSITRTSLKPDESASGRRELEHGLVCIPDLGKDVGRFAHERNLECEGFTTYYAVPLVAKGDVKGVLEVFHRTTLSPDDEWLAFLETLAGQAAIAIDGATLFDELQRSNAELTVAYDATIEGWSRALDLRDRETEGHSRRVTEMSVRLARELGIEGSDLVNIRRGALLHDIGKMGIPDSVLLKPGKLTDEEWTLMRRHPDYAYEWLSPIAFLRPALDIPYCHHEKLDGTGYPRGLKGDEIPLAARIFAAVDIWDALRSDRPYRKGWPEDRILEHLRSLAGTHLDPTVVDAFFRCLTEEPDRRPNAAKEVVLA